MLHWDIVVSLETPISRGVTMSSNGNVIATSNSAAESSAVLPRGAIYPDEVVVSTQSGVGIYEREERSKYQQGVLMITSHRLVYKGSMESDQKNSPTTYDASIFIPLSVVTSTTYSRGFGTLSHPKIILNVTTHRSAGSALYYKFSFRQGGMNEMLVHLDRTLKNQLWVKKEVVHRPVAAAATTSHVSSSISPQSQIQQATSQQNSLPGNNNNNAASVAPQPPASPSSNSTNNNAVISRNNDKEEDMSYMNIGIGRAVQNQNKKAEEAQVLLAHQRNQALSDVDSLMRNANKLVEAVAQLRSQQQQGQYGSGGNSNEILTVEAALGLGSMVSGTAGLGGSGSATGGSQTIGQASYQQTAPSNRNARNYLATTYYSSLGSELAAWLSHPRNPYSQRLIIPLGELFATYNKARQGESVVSAPEFLEACIALTADSIKRAVTTSTTNSFSLTARNKTVALPQTLLDGKLLETSSPTESMLKHLCGNALELGNNTTSFNELDKTEQRKVFKGLTASYKKSLATAMSANRIAVVDSPDALFVYPLSNTIPSTTSYYELKRYRNGSLCLQLPSLSSKFVEILRKLLCSDIIGDSKTTKMSSVKPFLTVTQFSTLLGVHNDIAEELLASLELAGVLCRDDAQLVSDQNQTSKSKSLANGVVSDEFLSTLWTSPLFTDGKQYSSIAPKGASRWYWNWFFSS